jgi:predicted PurR-regulated permease PerM
VAGSTLFGAFGAFLAVPVSAMAINVVAEYRAHNGELAAAAAAAAAGPDPPPD